MITNHSFFKSLGNAIKQENNPELWEQANKLFEEKKYLECFHTTLNYIDQSIFEKFANPDKTKFMIPQGSIVVNIELKGNILFFSAPFVKVPEQKFMPIFRKCIELNFAVMTLPQIVLREDKLFFEYSTPLELISPYKIYSLLRDIAQNADKYDDEFIEKFGAESVSESLAKPMEIETLELCLVNIKKIAREALEKSLYYEEKRRMHNACDAIYVGLKQIDYYCEPSGTFNNKLQDCVSAMFDRDSDMITRIKMGKAFLASIEDFNTDNIKNAVFYNYCLINVKRNMNRKGLKNWIEDLYDQTVEKYEKDDYTAAAYLGLYTFYTLLGDFNLDKHIQECLEYVLEKTAGKEFTEEVCEEFLDLMEFFTENVDDEYPKLESNTTNDTDYELVAKNAMSQYQSIMGNFMKMFNK